MLQEAEGFGPEQHLEGNESLGLEAGSRPGEGIPTQSAPPVRAHLLYVGKRLIPPADNSGHTNVSTTRIYTAESGTVHARQMERMGLVIT